MGEAKDASPSAATASTAQVTLHPGVNGLIEHSTASAAVPLVQPPVPGVPVGPGPYDSPYGPGQDRPEGHGSYHAQGPPVTASYPYHNQVPQSFEVTEAHRPQQRLPCGIGYQFILFIVGWFFPILWYIGAFMPLCTQRIDTREKRGWLINSVCAVVFTIIVIFAVNDEHDPYGIHDNMKQAASDYENFLAVKRAQERSLLSNM